MELGAVGEGTRRKLQSSRIKKGRKWGVDIARDPGGRGGGGGGRYMKGMQET